eukprot:m.192568 g.192568  ORF g.192568 m.192568 type:complete len:54 (+) comp14858_c0_seq1:128-289(+)
MQNRKVTHISSTNGPVKYQMQVTTETSNMLKHAQPRTLSNYYSTTKFGWTMTT